MAALSIEELQSAFGHLWVDTSLRMLTDTYVTVIETKIEIGEAGATTAIVRIELEQVTKPIVD
jgi:hypothetical protein